MDSLLNKYGILLRRSKMELYINPNLLNSNEQFENYSIVANEGTLIKVFQTEDASLNNTQLCKVQVIEYKKNEPIYENLYLCPQNNIFITSDELWPFIISINSQKRRLVFIQSKKFQWVIYIKLNDFVSVNGDAFDLKKMRYDCIVRYIGPVPELHPVGYFFGLELLHLDHGESPQREKIPFSKKYMPCDPSLSIFITADWISQIPLEVKKKFSAINVISDTIDKVCSAINNNNFISFNSNSGKSDNTRGQEKKGKTSNFYILELDAGQNSETKTMSERNCSDNKYTTESNCNLYSSNEDVVENHCSNHDRAKDYPGILKQNQKNKENKISGITSLEGRDIIVIDNLDIQESTRNESDVIVVEKTFQNEVDLADLLGSNWPKGAGDAAIILNKQKQQTRNNSIGNSNINKSKVEKIKACNQLSNLPTDNKINQNYDKVSASFFMESDEHATKPLKLNIKEINEKILSTAVDQVQLSQGSPLQEVPGTLLGIGSVVEVSPSNNAVKLYGVIRWIGVPPAAQDVMVGIELEDKIENEYLTTSNGSFNGFPLFKCQEDRAVFVLPKHCANDKRFMEIEVPSGGKEVVEKESELEAFGIVECPTVPGSVAPLKISNLEELEEICGKFKGIQGHHNSCYLDATLFAMFTFTSVFDSLLYRSPDANDIANYVEVQSVLREEIVNPLRKKLFVRADRVMKLRQLLDKLSSVSGLTSEEKDPEEFLNSLLAQIMRVEPFLKLNSGQDSYFYQLFVEKDEKLTFPTVQQLFEQSFHSSDIKLKEVPSCMIIQMPRFGKSYKMYQRILPSQVLDVTDIIENSPRQCTVCGKLAEFECRDCFGNLHGGIGLEGTAFCENCLETVHMHAKRVNHKSSALTVPQDFRIMAEHMTVPRLYMELFAVVCIETSHYVSFVKAGSGPDAPWCFFDSMADRKGEQNGYNIPELMTVPDIPTWLSDDGAKTVHESSVTDKLLPEHAKRLFCDAYMCMYQSTDVMMYR